MTIAPTNSVPLSIGTAMCVLAPPSATDGPGICSRPAGYVPRSGVERGHDPAGQRCCGVRRFRHRCGTGNDRRQRIAQEIDASLMSRYELIFSRRGGSAVVEVAAGICQGCYMNIPPQLWNEIIRSEKLNLCPSCQRILHYKAPEGHEKTA